MPQSGGGSRCRGRFFGGPYGGKDFKLQEMGKGELEKKEGVRDDGAFQSHLQFLSMD